MKIVINKSAIKSENLNQSEINIIKMLEEKEDFEFLISHFRASLRIPPRGLPTEKQLSDIYLNAEQIENAINFLLDRYSFSRAWAYTFLSILLYGVAVKPEYVEVLAQPDLGGKDLELHLIIKEAISRDEVKKSLYFPKIAKAIDDGLKQILQHPDLSRATFPDKYQEIKNLQFNNGSKKLTNEQVSDILKDKDGGKRVVGIKCEFKKQSKKLLDKKSFRERMIQLISLQ